jgi:hypothetical protein
VALRVEAVPTDVEPVSCVLDGPRQAAHVLAVRLEDDDVFASTGELPGRRESGGPGSDDHMAPHPAACAHEQAVHPEAEESRAGGATSWSAIPGGRWQ